MNNRQLNKLKNKLWANQIGVNYTKHIFPISSFSLKSTTEHREIVIEDQMFVFTPPSPKFGASIREGEWTINIKFQQPWEFPISSKLNYLLSGSPQYLSNGYWIRYANGKLLCRVNKKTKFTGGYLIEPSDVFQAVFQDKMFRSELTDKHGYTKGLLKLLGSTDILTEHGVRNLFWEMQKGNFFTIEEIKSKLKMGATNDKVINILVKQKILLRGMSFRCMSCGLLTWHPINRLDEEMQCNGCMKSLRLPIQSPIVFKLNELVARATNQGSIPVLLTHKVLSQEINNQQVLSLFGLEIEKKRFKIRY